MDTLKNSFEIIEEKSIKDTKIKLKNIDINTESYECKILTEESINYVLKFQIIYDNENRNLIYDVSDTISLEDYLKNYKLKKADICGLIVSIDKMLMELENYLVSENSVSLDLRLIRVYKNSDEKIKFKFIAIPNYNSDFSYELSKLLIRVLRFIDVNDKEALNIAYGLFVRSSKENYTINDLLALVGTEDENESYINYDSNDLYEYDEMIADEISEEMLNKEDAKYIDLDDVEQTFKSDNDNNIADKEIAMDNDTKSIIDEHFFDDFYKDDKKILKFNKNKKTKKKNALNAHINVNFICYVIVPMLIVALPILYFLINGEQTFINNIVAILAYEFIVITLLIIGRILSLETKKYDFYV